MQRLKKKRVRLVWPGYLWSRNSATATYCHLMMDQPQRSRSDGGGESYCNTGVFLGGGAQPSARRTMCPLDGRPRTASNVCWDPITAVVCFSFVLNHRWKSLLCVFGSTRTRSRPCSLDRVAVTCHLSPCQVTDSKQVSPQTCNFLM